MRRENVQPSLEDIQAMHAAIYYYRKNLHNPVHHDQLISDAYIGLTRALSNFSQDKNKNRKQYLMLSIKYYLMQVWIRETRSKNKHQIKVVSIDEDLNDDGYNHKDILESSQKNQEDIMLENEVMDIVEKTFGEIKKKNKRDWDGNDLFVILMLRMENFTLKEIANLFDYSELRMWRVYSNKIMPILNEIRERLSDAL